ncbi:hypothetical protein G3496_08380 [Shewanella baltica]|uniref:hypothetical protein n=1 Tax=Shewanella baltica TaxID=62322 RepID=UPI00217E0F0D|nr:hypothetical protein [Shewanella baltica]MCS6134945.1 hypothetical protein [Shewanella baltica]
MRALAVPKGVSDLNEKIENGESSLTDVKINKFGKIYSIISVVFIGAIGSGLWDLFLKDLIYYVGEIFVTVMSSIYTGYSDSLFTNVGKQSDVLMYIPSIFIIVIIIMSPLFVYIKLKRILRHLRETPSKVINNKVEGFLFNLIKNKQRFFVGIIIAPLFLMSIIYTDLLVKSVTNISAVNNMERWLTVVRPYIEERDYYKLESEFRMVNSRLSYQLLVNKVENHALKQSVELPELKLYGIETANKAIKSDMK